MRYISENEYNEKMSKIERANKSKERKRKLNEARKKYNSKVKPLSTSKLIAVYLFLVLNAVLVYAMAAMWKFQDLNSLGILVTDIAGQVLTYFIYAKKATAENTSADGTGIRFQAMMNEFYANAGLTEDESEANG